MDFNEITHKEDVEDVKAKLTADFVENINKNNNKLKKSIIPHDILGCLLYSVCVQN